ncbi:Dabb family protein [Spirosoma utsteinense]|uniref:Urocanate hydratase n=1 Tax=Spirosoma utsteinense TaxID=2585773 RepID=A0ABR6W7E6_9BACT|nr:Dabb family protein [Spirosoma utsteinense]MBC3784933.1 urocanate hydratase [Spirosoma utsteinense]MBC3792494.1 urocanate hydratase [Spirosoma utsteinense]
MFVHTVFFWLAHPESQSDRDALKAGLESLKSVKDISVAYIGKPADTRRPVVDHTYDFSITLVFADRAAHDAYQVHPVHLEFVAECAHLWNRVQIYDAVS